MIVHRGIYEELELNINWSSVTEENPIPAWTPLTAEGEIVGDSGTIYALLPMPITEEPLFPRAYVLVSGVLQPEDEEEVNLVSELADNACAEAGMDKSEDGKPAFFYFVKAGMETPSEDEQPVG